MNLFFFFLNEGGTEAAANPPARARAPRAVPLNACLFSVERTCDRRACRRKEVILLGAISYGCSKCIRVVGAVVGGLFHEPRPEFRETRSHDAKEDHLQRNLVGWWYGSVQLENSGGGRGGVWAVSLLGDEDHRGRDRTRRWEGVESQIHLQPRNVHHTRAYTPFRETAAGVRYLRTTAGCRRVVASSREGKPINRPTTPLALEATPELVSCVSWENECS